MISHIIHQRFAGAALAIGLALGAAGPALAQTGADAASPAEVSVSAGKSQVIELPGPYVDAMIADPKIADVVPLSNHSIYVVGKAMGSTALTVYGPGKRLIASANVVVDSDVGSLKNRLHELLPNEHSISVRSANQSIVLAGVVSSPAAAAQAALLAESYAPQKVVNLLGVEGTQQVMLSVRFVEMKRTMAKDLQVNVESAAQAVGHSPAFSIGTGDTINGNTNILNNLFGPMAARIGRGQGGLNVIFDALENKGLVKTLAEPDLVAMSGDTASFLAGGEFPIPVAQNGTCLPGSNNCSSTITVQYKPFGVALSFTPTILSDGMINLVVSPEVSAIDPSTSIVVGPIQIPGIKVDRAHTTVELRDGESFTIAGLLAENYQTQIRQFPFVGDVPVLGALFRSNGYKRDETELVVVVTPHLVTGRRGHIATPEQSFVPPSDFELFLFGQQQASANTVKPEERALLSADPTKAGVDGPHGHVLY
ncbi:type II and III secretion system protein family protein [Phenylobacterium montanum]|uniref:Type II and III secretion system protein family protein n=1 Tax=Phenylobacterium montanum TaxID=2823693 RepID=A0A975G119_9CAUL|nr:type II and III secretion system protein family protein [Caulobacter sp. S6]QUD88583.1 type II and III secretion system protein family protein [Caulobacter sp. S6]